MKDYLGKSKENSKEYGNKISVRSRRDPVLRASSEESPPSWDGAQACVQKNLLLSEGGRGSCVLLEGQHTPRMACVSLAIPTLPRCGTVGTAAGHWTLGTLEKPPCAVGLGAGNAAHSLEARGTFATKPLAKMKRCCGQLLASALQSWAQGRQEPGAREAACWAEGC